jgi:hypothetical protein
MGWPIPGFKATTLPEWVPIVLFGETAGILSFQEMPLFGQTQIHSYEMTTLNRGRFVRVVETKPRNGR